MPTINFERPKLILKCTSTILGDFWKILYSSICGEEAQGRAKFRPDSKFSITAEEF